MNIMATTVAPAAAPAHQQTLQNGLRPVRSVMAKADLKKVQKHAIWTEDAADCRLAMVLARLSQKETAARLDLSESGLAAQLAAAERPQTELWRADEVLRGTYLIALAMRRPDLFDVVTTISIRRTA